MISHAMQDAINKQINAEMYSSYLYLSMAAYFDSLSMEGMGSWMRVQAQEEMVHAMKFFDFVNERGGRVVLETIAKPEVEWPSPKAVFEAVYAHEKLVTSLINGLVDVAEAEKDRASQIFLDWFVAEQVEEEATASAIVDKLAMFGDSPQALYMIEKELGARVFTPPTAAAQ